MLVTSFHFSNKIYNSNNIVMIRDTERESEGKLSHCFFLSFIRNVLLFVKLISILVKYADKNNSNIQHFRKQFVTCSNSHIQILYFIVLFLDCVFACYFSYFLPYVGTILSIHKSLPCLFSFYNVFFSIFMCLL